MAEENPSERLQEIPSTEIEKIGPTPFAIGAFADVYLCTWRNKNVAVKLLRINQQNSQMTDLKAEIQVGLKLTHPNIVKLLGSTQFEKNLGIVMEWADQSSLRSCIKTLNLEQKVSVSLDVCEGLLYLHSKRVVHRDLKPENILLFGSKPSAKISDFGVSRVIQTMGRNTSMTGTPKYTSPELFQPGAQYDFKADIFSLSIIFFELFSGEDPFPYCADVMQVITAVMVMKMRPAFPSNFPQQLETILTKGWSEIKEERPHVEEFSKALKTIAASKYVSEQGWPTNKKDRKATKHRRTATGGEQVRRRKNSDESGDPIDIDTILDEAEKNLKAHTIYHDFAADIKLAMKWVNDCAKQLTASELGNSLQQVETLIVKHDNLDKEISSHLEVNDDLKIRGRDVARKNPTHRSNIEIMIEKLITGQNDLLKISAARRQNLQDSKELQKFIINCQDTKKSIAHKDKYISQKLRFQEKFLDDLLKRITEYQADLKSQKMDIQRIEKQCDVLAAIPLFKQDDIKKVMRDLAADFSLYESKLMTQKERLQNHQRRMIDYKQNAAETLKLIQAKLPEANNSNLGENLTQTEELIKEFSIFRDSVSEVKNRKNLFDSISTQFKKEVFTNGTDDADFLAWIEGATNEVSKSWSSLDERMNKRHLTLTSHRNFFIFRAKVSDIQAWVQAQEKAVEGKYGLRSFIEIDNSKKALEKIKENINVKQKEFSVICNEAEPLQNCPLDVKQEMERSANELKLLLDNLHLKLDERREEIDQNEMLLQFNQDYVELLKWINEIIKEMLSPELSIDNTNSEAMISKHRIIEGNIKMWKNSKFTKFIKTGETLSEFSFLDKGEVLRKKNTLTKRKDFLENCFELRNNVYLQHQRYLKWLGSVSKLEDIMLKSGDEKFVNVSEDELDSLSFRLFEEYEAEHCVLESIESCLALMDHNAFKKRAREASGKPILTRVESVRTATVSPAPQAQIQRSQSFWDVSQSPVVASKPKQEIPRVKEVNNIQEEYFYKHSGNLTITNLKEYFELKQTMIQNHESINRAWKKYYVVFTGSKLDFYKDEKDYTKSKNLAKSIPLEGSKFKHDKKHDKRKFTIHIKTASPDSSEYLMDVESQVKLTKWLNAINRQNTSTEI